MKFYARERGKIAWQNPRVFSLFYFLRDAIVFLLPIGKLSHQLVKLLYGVSPQFIFLVHARRTEDTYVGLPILSLVRRMLGRKVFFNILQWLPPLVLGTIKTSQGIHGLVVTAGGILPEHIFLKKKASLKKAVQALVFSSKLCKKNSIFGIGGLWPMVTRRGLGLVPFAKKHQMVITNGHCGTLMALYFSIEKIAEISNTPLEKLKVIILGVGKMGANLAKVLYGKVAAITLADVNEKRLENLEQKLKEAISSTDIFKFLNRQEVGTLNDLFKNNHIVICTTSNVRRILKPEDIPAGTLILDDSRPEAIPRNLNKKSIVLEGGLLRIKGLKQEFNFGMGIDENVFGCLAESFLLAADKERLIFNVVGDVGIENFRKMVELAKKFGVQVGDFKCREHTIDPSEISRIVQEKVNLDATIPFKKVCWLLKVEDFLGVD